VAARLADAWVRNALAVNANLAAWADLRAGRDALPVHAVLPDAADLAITGVSDTGSTSAHLAFRTSEHVAIHALAKAAFLVRAAGHVLAEAVALSVCLAAHIAGVALHVEAKARDAVAFVHSWSLAWLPIVEAWEGDAGPSRRKRELVLFARRDALAVIADASRVAEVAVVNVTVAVVVDAVADLLLGEDKAHALDAAVNAFVVARCTHIIPALLRQGREASGHASAQALCITERWLARPRRFVYLTVTVIVHAVAHLGESAARRLTHHGTPQRIAHRDAVAATRCGAGLAYPRQLSSRRRIVHLAVAVVVEAVADLRFGQPLTLALAPSPAHTCLDPYPAFAHARACDEVTLGATIIAPAAWDAVVDNPVALVVSPVALFGSGHCLGRLHGPEAVHAHLGACMAHPHPLGPVGTRVEGAREALVNGAIAVVVHAVAHFGCWRDRVLAFGKVPIHAGLGSERARPDTHARLEVTPFRRRVAEDCLKAIIRDSVAVVIEAIALLWRGDNLRTGDLPDAEVACFLARLTDPHAFCPGRTRVV